MRDDDLPGNLGNTALYGRITSVDLARARVIVGAGDLETAPIRWITGGASGTRVWTRPKIGEQVMLLSPDGDLAGAIALRGVTSDTFPPIGDADREVVEFEDGTAIGYDPAEGALTVMLVSGGKIRIIAAGGVRIEADVEIAGNLKVTGSIEAIGDILRTAVGSRVARREYGSLASELVDQPGNDLGRMRLIAAVAGAIARWEPRLILTRVGFTEASAAGGFALLVEGDRTDQPDARDPARFTLPLRLLPA